MKYFINFFKFRFVANAAIFVAFVALFLFSQFSQKANSQVIDSSFYEWTVYEIQESELEDKQCYIVSHPTKSDSNHSSRQNPYFIITRFQKDRVEEVSVFGGFEFKMSSDVLMRIDGKEFNLTAKNDIAWAATKFADVKIIEALLNGAVLKIRSDSAIGTYAVDEYSLKGIARAYARMKEICKSPS